MMRKEGRGGVSALAAGMNVTHRPGKTSTYEVTGQALLCLLPILCILGAVEAG